MLESFVTASCRFGRILLSLACFSLFSSASAQPEQTVAQRNYLVFGFLPIVSSERLVDRFSPLVDYLSAELAMDIRMETAPDFKEFVRRTHEEKRYDILFTAPHLYYLARQVSGYRSLARVDEEGMKAVIVVPVKSDVASIQDLRGRRLAITGPLALATVLVRDQIARSSLDPDEDLTLITTPSHNASLLSSYKGTTDASALMLPVYRRASPEILDNMKIVAETQSVPHIPISVAPWVNEAVAERLRLILINLQNDDAGRTLLGRLGWPGFTATSEQDYDSLEWVTRQMQVE